MTCLNKQMYKNNHKSKKNNGLAGRVFGDSWKHQITHFKASSSNSQAALQYVLPWFYTCRLDVPFDAVPAALELCQQAQLTELVTEADLTLNSEGTCFLLL